MAWIPVRNVSVLTATQVLVASVNLLFSRLFDIVIVPLIRVTKQITRSSTLIENTCCACFQTKRSIYVVLSLEKTESESLFGFTSLQHTTPQGILFSVAGRLSLGLVVMNLLNIIPSPLLQFIFHFRAAFVYFQLPFTTFRDFRKLCFMCTYPCPVLYGVIRYTEAPCDSCFCRDDAWSSVSPYITSCINYEWFWRDVGPV